MKQKNRRVSFNSFIENSQLIFDSFPNEQVWLQGGLNPNRQLLKPEAGYCIVIRYDEKTISTISHFMSKIRSVLPPVVEYNESNLHSTIGTYGKGDMNKFTPDPETLQDISYSIEVGLTKRRKNLYIEFGTWLYNDEVILISGYPSQSLWNYFQDIGVSCQEKGYPLEIGRIAHITTARFISSISHQKFEQFALLMKSAPIIDPAKVTAIDLATWFCNGIKFEIITHNHFNL